MMKKFKFIYKKLTLASCFSAQLTSGSCMTFFATSEEDKALRPLLLSTDLKDKKEN